VKLGCHSDRAPNRRLPWWSESDRCGAYESGLEYPGREQCETCQWRERMPRESWLRYWWRERMTRGKEGQQQLESQPAGRWYFHLEAYQWPEEEN